MEDNILITPENDPKEWVGYDLGEYPFNKKYPFNKTRYGQSYERYTNKALGVLLYDYCVMIYDVGLSFKGKKYYFNVSSMKIIKRESVAYQGPFQDLSLVSLGKGSTLLFHR